jgi:hypothetical protein
MRWREAIVILLKVAGLGRSVGCGRVCVSPCLCLRRCLCLCLCVCFVYPAQGPGGETSVEARKGHHAHATARQRLALAECLLRQGTTMSDGAGSECGDGLELEPAVFFYHTNTRNRRWRSWMSFLGLVPGGSAPPGWSPVGGVQGTATWQHVIGILLCMPVTPVRRRRRKASASRLRTAEDDNRRGPGCAWTYVPSKQDARISRGSLS